MGMNLEEIFDVPPLKFFDANWGEMAYVYPDTKHSFAGWLLRKTRGGEWITYRKATEEDVSKLSGKARVPKNGLRRISARATSPARKPATPARGEQSE